MPRSKQHSHHRILGKAMAILALPLTPISKAKGPIARNLLLFKKCSRRRPYKQFRHYNFAYVGEYQFSPSNSPLIPYPPGVSAWRKGGGNRKLRSRARMVLASLLCGGDDVDVAVVEGLPQAVEVREREMRAVEWMDDEEDDDEEDEEDEGDEEVDGRAERFIEKFYAEMRLQRQRSLVQLL